MKLGRKFLAFLLALVVIPSLTTGCYFWERVKEGQLGLHLTDGAKLTKVHPPGMRNSFDPWDTLEIINVSALMSEWSDPDLVTKDKQPISLVLSITYSRSTDEADVRNMFSRYHQQAMDDEALARMVIARIPDVAKTVTAQYTLDEMLGISVATQSGAAAPAAASSEAGRATVAGKIATLLKAELTEFGVVLQNVSVNNIGPDEGYLSALKEKANAHVNVEVAKQKALQLVEQLNQEKAQTDIEVEQARRKNEVNAELAKTYSLSPEYYELERLRLLQGVVGDKDKIYFVPDGANLTMFLSGNGSGLVVPPAPPQ